MRRALINAGASGLIGAINDFWRGEPSHVVASVIGLFRQLVASVGNDALDEVNAGALSDDIMTDLERFADENATRFAQQMTRTSRNQVNRVIQAWLETEGATLDELIERLRPVWSGPRPDVAATTESTRLVADSRIRAWNEAGIEFYDVRTKNDDRVRPHHRDVAENGPYPITDERHKPPINGDANCRCTVVAAGLE